jgi:hypothetical protein
MRPKGGHKSGLWHNFFKLKENYAENMRQFRMKFKIIKIIPDLYNFDCLQ